MYSTAEKEHLDTRGSTYVIIIIIKNKEEKLFCKTVVPFYQESAALLAYSCQETALAGEVLFPLASHYSWSQ